MCVCVCVCVISVYKTFLMSHHLFQECKQYISQTEEKGYVKALLNIGGGKYVFETEVNINIYVNDYDNNIIKDDNNYI